MNKVFQNLLLMFVFSTMLSTAQETNPILPVDFRYGSFYPQRIENKISTPYFKPVLFEGKYYMLIQFTGIPTQNDLAKLTKTGVTLFNYLMNFTYMASVDEDQLVALYSFNTIRSIDIIPDKAKYDHRLDDGIPTYAISKPGYIDVSLLYFPDIPMDKVINKLQSNGIELLHVAPSLNNLVLRIPVNMIQTIASSPWLQWMEPSGIPLISDNLPGKTNHRSNVLNASYPGARNLTGKGIKVGVWDAGQVGSHIDFIDRLSIRENLHAVHTHATHVSGTVAGAGIIDPYGKGMAPQALLYSWDFWGWIPTEMDSAYNLDTIEITSNSYAYDPAYDTCKDRGYYDIISNLLDITVNNHPDFTHVFAAGNYQSHCSSAGFRTISSGYQASKNNITVGAVNDKDQMSSFSSWGPMRDNRLKPEICAVGVGVKSTYPNNLYAALNGTSMACPGVSGTIAQLYERYKQLFNSSPNASTVRAVVCNTAFDLGTIGPDFKYGYGRINGLTAVQTFEDGRFKESSISNSGSIYDTIIVPAGTKQMKVMLCWSDPAASPNLKYTAKTLINNLDLQLRDTSGNIFYPYILNPANPSASATTGTDTLNNIEQVVINNPYPGKYYILVKGTSVPSGPQLYAITYVFYENEIVVTYPFGGEGFIPLTNEIIRWDAFGATGKFRIEFSADNGINWKNVDTNLSISLRSYQWTLPDTSSPNCLIRISSTNSLSGVSDTNFSIMYYPALLYAIPCNQQVTLLWDSVSFAKSYDVFHLLKGQWNFAGNTTDTFFTVLGLNNKQDQWFSFTARNKDDAFSEHSIGMEFKPDSTKFPPVIIKQPYINDTVCLGGIKILSANTTFASIVSKQWQISKDHGSTWSDIPGATDTTLHITNISATQDMYKYRIYFVNNCKNRVYSDEVTLQVDSGVTFTKHPKGIITCVGDTVVFEAKAICKTQFKYQWQHSIDQGIHWIDMIGANDSTLVLVNVQYLQNGISYRAKGISQCFADDTSFSAVLNVHPPLEVKIFQTKDTICIGDTVILDAKAIGGDTSRYLYKWSIPSGNKSMIKVNPSITTSYYVSLYDSCSADTVRDSVFIYVKLPLEVKILALEDTICYGSRIELFALASGGDYPNYFFNWNNGLYKNWTFIDTPLVTIKYKVEMTDHCTFKNELDSIIIFVRDELKTTLTSNKDTLCVGQPVRLQAFPSGGDTLNYHFYWNNTLGFNQVLVDTPLNSITYHIKVDDMCSPKPAVDSYRIVVRSPLSVNLSATRDTICQGDMVRLTAHPSGGQTGTYSYEWKNFPDTITVLIDSPKVNTVYEFILKDHCTLLPVVATKDISVIHVNANWNQTTNYLDVQFNALNQSGKTYSWDFGDGKISNLINPTHTYSLKGTYLVCLNVTDSFGCMSSTCTHVTVNPSGLIESHANSMKVGIYPNPGHGKFNVLFRDNSPVKYEFFVYSTLGEKIKVNADRIDLNHYTLDLSGFASGVYFMLIRSESNIFSEKLIIK